MCYVVTQKTNFLHPVNRIHLVEIRMRTTLMSSTVYRKPTRTNIYPKCQITPPQQIQGVANIQIFQSNITQCKTTNANQNRSIEEKRIPIYQNQGNKSKPQPTGKKP